MRYLLIVLLFIGVAHAENKEKDVKTARDYAAGGVRAGVPQGMIVRRMINDGFTSDQIEKIMAELKQDPQKTIETLKLFSGPGKPVSPN